jgi:hypothetical protein
LLIYGNLLPKITERTRKGLFLLLCRLGAAAADVSVVINILRTKQHRCENIVTGEGNGTFFAYIIRVIKVYLAYGEPNEKR